MTGRQNELRFSPASPDNSAQVGRVDWMKAVEFFLWATFVFGVSSASHILGVEKPERFFWLPADAAAVGLFLIYPKEVLAEMARRLIIISWPVVAIFSALWSLTPAITLYHGVQLLLTVMLGVSLSIRLDLAGLAKVILFALLGAQVLSIMAVALIPYKAIGVGGEWLGVFPHKNVLGSMMVLQLITALSLLQNKGVRTVAAGCAGLALVLLYFSKSGSSALTAGIVIAVYAMWLAYLKGSALLGLAAGALTSVATVCVAALAGATGSLMDNFLTFLGKDASLTGRTVLWQFGVDQIQREPLIGVGYKAYWESWTTSARYLRYVLDQDLWFFHNNIVDVGVAFGLLGLVLFSAGLIYCIWMASLLMLKSNNLLDVWPLILTVYILVQSTVENPLFQNHSLQQVLLVAALGVGGKRLLELDKRAAMTPVSRSAAAFR